MDADEAQRRYVDRLAPGYRQAGFWRRAFTPWGRHVASASYEIDRGELAQQRFLERARSRFAGTAWAPLFESVAAPGPSND